MSSPLKQCSAARCVRRIPRRLLMCARHWGMVPADLQRNVYSAWRGFDQPGGMRPYFLAVAHAQLAVAEAEKLSDCAEYLRGEIARLEQEASRV